MAKRMGMAFLILMASGICKNTLADTRPIAVVTTIPDLKEVVEKIGRDKVQVESLLSGTEDVHFVDAVPTFIQKVSNAEVVCLVGLDLEVGWLPKVLAKSGNAKVQPGGLGYCDTGKAVQALEKPIGTVDRSMGDVHPFGNPHFNLSPSGLTQASQVVLAALVAARPEQKDFFQKNQKDFVKEMVNLAEKIRKILPDASRLKSMAVIEYHKEFSYFLDQYGVRSFGSIQEKPGVHPSAGRLAEVSQSAKSQDVLLALDAYYSPEKHLKKFTEISGIPARKLPTLVQLGKPDLDSIEKVQIAIAKTIREQFDAKAAVKPGQNK